MWIMMIALSVRKLIESSSTPTLEWFEDYPLVFQIGDKGIQVTPVTPTLADEYTLQEEISIGKRANRISITKSQQQQRVYTITLSDDYPWFAQVTIPQCSPLERVLKMSKTYRCTMAVTDHIDVEVRKPSHATFEIFTTPEVLISS